MFAGAPFAGFQWAGMLVPETAAITAVGGTPIPRRRRWWRPRIQEDEEQLMHLTGP